MKSWPLPTLALTLVTSHIIERVFSLDLALYVDQNLIETLPRVVTSIWSHSGWLHLGANLIGLAVFGLIAGRVWSAPKVVSIFVAGGLAGGVTVLLASMLGITNSNGTRGTSAAILAVVASVLTERSAALRFDLAWGSALAVVVLSVVPVSGISIEAHLGGALVGLVFSWPRPPTTNKVEKSPLY